MTPTATHHDNDHHHPYQHHEKRAPGKFFKHIFIHLLIIYYQVNYDNNKVKDGGTECMGASGKLYYIIYLFLIIKFHLQLNYNDYVYDHHQHRDWVCQLPPPPPPPPPPHVVMPAPLPCTSIGCNALDERDDEDRSGWGAGQTGQHKCLFC